MKKKFQIPSDFLWGTATAATQVDGGDAASDWAEFCKQPGRILDGSSSITACDHWNRYKEDFALMKKMGLNAYRLGVDWSRFEPEPGRQDTKALEHFRAMLQELKKQKLQPLLTLYHFVLPRWWAERGGWTNEDNIEAFVRFCTWMVEHVGDLVHEYITINEPTVYTVMSYLDGKWPPAESGLFAYFTATKVMKNLALAHFQVYDAIHEIHARKKFKTPRVSIAKHLRVMDPLTPDNSWDQGRVEMVDAFFNLSFCDTLQSGKLEGGLGKGERVHDGRAWEFLGINYYSRDIVSFDPFAPGRAFVRTQVKEGTPRNDLNWEVYPEGLTRLLLRFHNRYGLPIRITENGIADAKDAMRSDFLVSHIRAMEEAMQVGVPVEGYYHWSFMDNFEWAEGYTARFGLVGVDFATQKRTLRKSAETYKKIIKNRGTAKL